MEELVSKIMSHVTQLGATELISNEVMRGTLSYIYSIIKMDTNLRLGLSSYLDRISQFETMS